MGLLGLGLARGQGLRVEEVVGGLEVPWALASHFQMWRSVPQMLAASTRTRISPGPGSGTGRSTRVRPSSGASLAKARIPAPCYHR